MLYIGSLLTPFLLLSLGIKYHSRLPLIRPQLHSPIRTQVTDFNPTNWKAQTLNLKISDPALELKDRLLITKSVPNSPHFFSVNLVFEPTLNQTCLRDSPPAPFAFKNSMIHNLQFTLLIALCCVLHRCTSLEIHR
jgi:hypothetical protein